MEIKIQKEESINEYTGQRTGIKKAKQILNELTKEELINRYIYRINLMEIYFIIFVMIIGFGLLLLLLSTI